MITTHTRRTKYGFTGFVQIQDGSMRRSHGTHTVRLTRADAHADAVWLKKDILANHKNTGLEDAHASA